MGHQTQETVALGIDIGTGSTKAGLIDGDGRLLAVARAGHAIDEPRPGWSESDPQDWLVSVRAAVGDVMAIAAEQRREIIAVGFSGQMHGVVPCRCDGAPVRPAVLWSDRRSQQHLDGLRAKLSPADHKLLANPVVAGMAGPTMAALACAEPDVVAATDVIVQAKDWVRWRLTGEVATDPSDASATLLWDTEADRWMARACEVFEVEQRWLPPVRPSAAQAGTTSAHGAEVIGVPAGLPVAFGAADTAAALLGAGIKPGETQVSTGTGGQIAQPLAERPRETADGIHLFRTAEAGERNDKPLAATGAGAPWYAMAAIQNAGIAIDWALGVLCLDIVDAADAVAASPVGSNGVSFLPYLTGERTPHLDAELHGAWSGLRPTTTRADLVRSVFEGVAFALRDGLDALASSTLAGGISTALLAGGGSIAPWWRQMLADVLGISLVPHDAGDASVRGAALLAMASVGVVIDPAAGVLRGAPIEPREEQAEDYRRARARFLAAFVCSSPPVLI